MRWLWVSWVIFLLAAPVSAAEELRVAAASDLSYAFRELAERFEKETGNVLRLSLGSSGNFFSQIENGAPFDVFFSADIDYPRRLEADGLAAPGSIYRYAVGRLVVWVPASSPIEIERLGMKALLDPAAKRIAIANPQHAPYGRAAVAAMRHFAVYDQVKGKLVFGENISQAAQFVQSGNAQIGVLALSLACASPMKEGGKYWEVPMDAHPRIEQAAVILKSSPRKKAADALLAFLSSGTGREILRRYGFALPDEATSPGIAAGGRELAGRPVVQH
jgi:molybdate transport system substrate-binding protein